MKISLVNSRTSVLVLAAAFLFVAAPAHAAPLDTTPPIFDPYPNVQFVTTTGANGVNFAYTLPTATDDVDASVTVNCVPAPGSLFPLSFPGPSTDVSCTAHDSQGNSAVKLFSVTVQYSHPTFDAAALDLFNNGYSTTATSSVGARGNYPLPVATDAVEGTANVSCDIPPGTVFLPGNTKVNCTASNSHFSVSNFFYVSVTVVPDVTPPVITLTGSDPVTLTVADTYTDAGATATDDRDGSLTSNIVTGGSVDTATAGTYTLTYDVSDSSGNAALQVTRTVTVNAAPVVPAPTPSSSSSSSGGSTHHASPPSSGGGPVTVATTTAPAPLVLGASTYFFTNDLSPGTSGDEVFELQKVLIRLGFFTVAPNSYFGPATKAAVRAFQAAHGLNSIGYVRAGTRAALNAQGAASVGMIDRAAIQAQIDALLIAIHSLMVQLHLAT